MGVRDSLVEADVGYVQTGLKSMSGLRIGDTLFSGPTAPEPVLPLLAERKPMVFASIWPATGADYTALEEALGRLLLEDSTVTSQRIGSPAFGQGMRCGFLGPLHVEVFRDRLEEQGASAIFTPPTVPFEVDLKKGGTLVCSSPLEYPASHEIAETREPLVRASIFAGSAALSGLLQLVEASRGVLLDTKFLSAERIIVECEVPLAEVATADFYDKFASRTQGGGSIDYVDAGSQKCRVAMLEMKLNGAAVEPLSSLVIESRATELAKRYAAALKEHLPRQGVPIAVQGVAMGKVLARETIKPFRKAVTEGKIVRCRTEQGGPCVCVLSPLSDTPSYSTQTGKDRKMKLLQKQKKGLKVKQRAFGGVTVDASIFSKII